MSRPGRVRSMARGLSACDSVTLWLAEVEATGQLLTEQLGIVV